MTINHDYEKTMQLLAECAARMGYKPDAMLTMPTPGGWCVKTFDATGKVFTKPDSVRSFAAEINKAWGKALQQLSDMDCDVTSAMVQKPFLANITNTVGISITESKMHFGCWLKTGTEAAEGEMLVGNYILYPLAEPFDVEFESTLNLTLPNLDAQDIFVLTDIDGMELSDVTVQRNGGTDAHPEFDIQIQPSQQWQQAHDGLLPPPLYLMNFGGINERIDAALILDLRRRIQALEAKQ